MKIKCDVIRDLLPLYMDGVVSDESRRLIEEHMEECDDCRRYLAELKGEEGEDVSIEFKGELEPLKKLRRKERFNRIALIVVLLAFVAMLVAFVSRYDWTYSWKVQDHASYTVPEGYELEGRYDDDSRWIYVRDEKEKYEKLEVACDDRRNIDWMEEDSVSLDNGWENWIFRTDYDHTKSNCLNGIMYFEDDSIHVEYSCKYKGKGDYYDSCSPEQEEELKAFMSTFKHHDTPVAEGNIFQRIWENIGPGGLVVMIPALLIIVIIPIAIMLSSISGGDAKKSAPVNSRELHDRMNEERKKRGEGSIPAINNMGGVSTNNLARRDKSWSSVPDFFVKMIRRK